MNFKVIITIAYSLTALGFIAFANESESKDSMDKIMESAIRLEEERIAVIDKVTDKKTAEAALPKLEAINKKSIFIHNRIVKLGLPNDFLAKEAGNKKYKKRVQKVVNELKKTLARLDDEARLIVESTMLYAHMSESR